MLACNFKRLTDPIGVHIAATAAWNMSLMLQVVHRLQPLEDWADTVAGDGSEADTSNS